MGKNKDLEKQEIINDDRYQVELAKDFSIPVIPENLVDVHQEVTGYTAGLITRDLVTMGEQLLKTKQKKK